MIDESNNTNPRTVLCAIYTRCATNDPQSDSTKSQERYCREVAAQRPGWVVLDDHVYSDTVTLRGRQGLDSLLLDARKFPLAFDCLLTADTSRVSRDIGNLCHLIDSLAQCGVDVYFVSQGLSSKYPYFSRS